jgi:DNA uptake protein ComE-like DNA-binding protein
MAGFKEFFTFTKAERRGIFILASILVLLILYDVFGPFRTNPKSDQEIFKAEVQEFLEHNKAARQDSVIEKTQKPKQLTKAPHKRKLNPHPFDPNMMSYEQWLELGLSERQAHTIKKYQSKGGHFYKPEDFRKIYCISESEYEQLAPYIIINGNDIENNTPEEEVVLNLDLNTVNEQEIQCVKGIGPAFARRIIKYRKLLGGYVRIDQLMEVYGMDSARYTAIKSYFTLGQDSIRKFPLNKVSFRALKYHPYISEELAYEITNYRKISGNFRSVEDLRKIKLVNDSLYQKIYLYFAVESK